MQDVQRYDEARKGLVSLKTPSKPKSTTLQFRDGKVFWQHCVKGFNELDEGNLEQFKSNLLSRLRYLQEHTIEGRWDFVGSIMNQSVFARGYFCEVCQRRYSMRIIPLPFEVPKLLERLRVGGIPLE